MYFNLTIVLRKPVPDDTTNEQLEQLASSCMKRHSYYESDEGHWDNFYLIDYVPVHCIDPAFVHAVLTPQGRWIHPNGMPEFTNPDDFPELQKVYWLRDKARWDEEIERITKIENAWQEQEDKRWQEQVIHMFERWIKAYAIRVRCHC